MHEVYIEYVMKLFLMSYYLAIKACENMHGIEIAILLATSIFSTLRFTINPERHEKAFLSLWVPLKSCPFVISVLPAP